jgi:hypothetical protein
MSATNRHPKVHVCPRPHETGQLVIHLFDEVCVHWKSCPAACPCRYADDPQYIRPQDSPDLIHAGKLLPEAIAQILADNCPTDYLIGFLAAGRAANTDEQLGIIQLMLRGISRILAKRHQSLSKDQGAST